MIKKIIKAIIPNSLLSWVHSNREAQYAKKLDKKFTGKDASVIFTDIYQNNRWGNKSHRGEFMSGHGSRSSLYVSPYVEAVKYFLAELPEKPVVVDLGCGDFHVGRQLVPLAARYVACDVVEPLIEQHQAEFSDPNLEFRRVNITTDELPQGDVVIVRQVLQHLSNEQIQGFIQRLGDATYRYMVLAEYLPKGDFEPNIDQPSGAHSRLARGIQSGVVLTAPPFDFQPVEEQKIAESEDDEGKLITLVYQLR